MEKQSNNKRLAKNTLLMYIRMGITVFVGLITARYVLQALGEEDFGLYNVVSGIVIFVTFLNSSLAHASQRFMSYAYGKGNVDVVQDTLNASFRIFIGLDIIVVLVSETIGLWFLNEKMSFAPEKIYLANWVFQFSVIITCLNILRTPFNALFISSERFDFYAKSAIVESGVHLIFVLLLFVDFVQPSYIYIVYQTITAFVILVWYYCYFRRKYKGEIEIAKVRDKSLYREFFSFSGWTVFGTLGVIGFQQGINVLLNIFFGVSVNAAFGIANRINSIVNQFFTGFQQAANPQITKAHAVGNVEEQTKLIIFTSKISFFLLLSVGVVVIYNIDYLLSLWLDNVPKHTSSLCCLMIIGAMIDSLSSPLYVTVYATGRIKLYQIIISLVLLSNIFFSYIGFYWGLPVESCMAIRIALFCIAYIVRLLFVKNYTDVDIKRILSEVIVRILVISIFMFAIVYFLFDIANPIFRLFCVTPLLFLFMIFMIYYLGFDRESRTLLKGKVVNGIVGYVKNKK